MQKAVSANEARTNFIALLDYVNEDGDEVIVESDGMPRGVLMSFAAFQEFQTMREQQRRADILERFRELQERLGTRNQDLTEEQAMELADRFSHEFVDDLAAEGKIRFERDRR